MRHSPELAAVYEPLLTSRSYGPGLREPTSERGLLAGWDDGEAGRVGRAGGNDPGRAVVRRDLSLRGHKWFTSAPMCDVFLVLAQAPAGLYCFLVPRVLPDGSRNVFRIQRLKDELGNRSNASSGPEFDGTVA